MAKTERSPACQVREQQAVVASPQPAKDIEPGGLDLSLHHRLA
jgi:hypothetical protein